MAKIITLFLEVGIFQNVGIPLMISTVSQPQDVNILRKAISDLAPPRLGERQDDRPPWHSIHSTKDPGLFVYTIQLPVLSTDPGHMAHISWLSCGPRHAVSRLEHASQCLTQTCGRHITSLTVRIAPAHRNRLWSSPFTVSCRFPHLC